MSLNKHSSKLLTTPLHNVKAHPLILIDASLPPIWRDFLLANDESMVTEFDRSTAEYKLFFTDDKLQLTSLKSQHKPLSCDFTTPSFLQRIQRASTQNEVLLRALRKINANTVLDGTAGFGQESMLLAALGFQITMIERSPILGVLLKDGIRRAADHPVFAQAQICFYQMDTLVFLTQNQLHPAFDAIYLDPMYPLDDKAGRSLNEIKMRVARELVGTDEDITQVFNAAFQNAQRRVFVKRPLSAPWLAPNPAPAYEYRRKTMRLDCYISES